MKDTPWGIITSSPKELEQSFSQDFLNVKKGSPFAIIILRGEQILLRPFEIPLLSHEETMRAIQVRLWDHGAFNPPLEVLSHAVLPPKFVDHVYPNAVLALTNQSDGKNLLREALGDEIRYFADGIMLGKMPQGLGDPQRARDALEIVMAAEKSAETGRIVDL